MRPVGASRSLRFAGPPGRRRIPPVTRGTLVLTVAGYLLTIFHVFGIVNFLIASPETLLKGQVWRLVTYPIVNSGILYILFDLLMLWWLGSELEPQWGSRSYAGFLVAATAFAGALGIGVSLLMNRISPVPGGLVRSLELYGSGATMTAIIVAWTLEAPNAPANYFGILPMTRKIFALIAVAVATFGTLEQPGHTVASIFFVLGGLPIAWLWVRGRRRQRYTSTFGGARPISPRLFRRRFRVIRNDDERIH